jgi:PTS system N-acetylglucosamine-specific IIC component
MSTATAPTAAPTKKWGSGLFQGLQKIGRSLQLPIAVLPAAGLLMRLGQPDVQAKLHLPTDVAKVFAGAGGILFDGSFGLPLLFCIGVAIGFAKKADGSTALAAVVSFLTYYAVIHQFPIKDGHDGATYTSVAPFGGFWQ